MNTPLQFVAIIVLAAVAGVAANVAHSWRSDGLSLEW